MKKIFLIILTLTLMNSLSLADKNMKIGSKGKMEDVTRTIQVKMYDNYYEPNSFNIKKGETINCLLYTSPSPRDLSTSRMPSSA